jgi:hypothetical protein
MAELPPGVTRWDGPPLGAWRPWTPAEVARRLAGVHVPWCVVGGWAIDLFLGGQTRRHGDLEIAVARADLPVLRRALDDFVLHAVGDGQVRALATGEPPPHDTHQNWVLDVEADAWRMDVMLEPGDATTWVYRRDGSIRAPRPFMVGCSADGVPFLQPHGALLFKAEGTRPKDEADLARCLPRLDDERRAWLAAALARTQPGHPWLDRLATPPG